MENKRLKRYVQLSTLQDIENEKRRLRQLIAKQEQAVEADWSEVYALWSFVPKTARVVRAALREIPNYFGFVKGFLNVWRGLRRKS